ncbi:MAG: TnpA family transposase, partial [Paraglaciecola sp.]
FLANQSAIQPDTVIGDTQGQSEPVFTLSYLMGIQLMPRMRNWFFCTFHRTITSLYHYNLLIFRYVSLGRSVNG